MQSRNLSIMLTDLKDYSEKSAVSTRSGIIDFVKTHNTLLRPAIEFYNGRVIKSMGDSLLCVFESATDAAVCAIAIQVIIQEFNRRQRDEENKPLTIRVIISSGDVTLEKGDIYGDAVNLVSRMEKHPEFKLGGIGLSESTYLLMNRQEIIAEEIGDFTFSGMGYAVKVYRVPIEKQKLTQLPTKLLDLVQQVSEGKIDDSNLVPLMTRFGKRLGGRYLAMVACSLVAVVVTVYAMRRREPAPAVGMNRVLSLLRESDPDRDGVIYRKDFSGPPEIFASLDSNRDDTISRDEVEKWADAQGVVLRPPPRR